MCRIITEFGEKKVFQKNFFEVILMPPNNKGKIALKLKVKNCPRCGRIFSPTPTAPFCRDCMIKEKEMELKVLQYVRDNPGVSMQDVMEATGASESLMKRMISEGLFRNINNSVSFYYPCTGCGRPIQHGVYCADCVGKLRKEVKKVSEDMHIRVKESEVKKMSTIDKLNKMAENEFERENRTKIMRNYVR